MLSCQKEGWPTKIVADVIIDNTIVDSPVIVDTIRQQDFLLHLIAGQEEFDWENAEYLPLPLSEEQIPMPWSDNAIRAFSDDIRYDFKKSDGWVLYQCSFSKQLNPYIKSFILYNKYKGILRYYYYLKSDNFSSNVFEYNVFKNEVKSIGEQAALSPILNFAHQKIVDVTTNSTQCVTIEPSQLSNRTWYALEYELAFDKNIYSRSYSTYRLGVGYEMLKVTGLKINGKELGSLNARIRFSDSDYDFGELYNGDANIIIYGKKDIDQITNVLSNADLTQVNQIYNQHSFEHILNGSIGDDYLGEIQWNAGVAIQTQPNAVGLPGGGETFVVSGANNSGMQGLGTFYDKPMGVFYLNTPPKVLFSKVESEENHKYQYSLDLKSLEYLFNPSLKEVADIKNIEQVLVATDHKDIMENNSRAKLYIGQKLLSNVELTIQGVRVSFDVVPKNGSKPVHIVKVFKAEIDVLK